MTTVLLTGGSGSFGQAFLKRVLPLGWVVRVFSRDELKQSVLAREFASGNVRWLIGDVRDSERVRFAAEGVDLVVHAAALKRVDACEYNPFECVKTNVVGTENVVKAALAAGVPRAVLLSSDKAVHPVNTYGASKLLAEKVWLGANAYGAGRTAFSVVRYGNVRGSRGSVAEVWSDTAQAAGFTLSSPLATRFWLDREEAVALCLTAVDEMRGGEVFVPKLVSSRVADLLPEGVVPRVTGLGRGEKLHEELVSGEEVGRTFDMGGHFVISEVAPAGGVLVGEGFRYSSGGAL